MRKALDAKKISFANSPSDESYLHDTPEEPIETSSYRCPLLCRAVPHHCWYVDRGMEMAMQLRRWLACPVPLDGGQMTVLDELYASQFREQSLGDIVSDSLRRVRESLEGVTCLNVFFKISTRGLSSKLYTMAGAGRYNDFGSGNFGNGARTFASGEATQFTGRNQVARRADFHSSAPSYRSVDESTLSTTSTWTLGTGS
jgi:hypothetical protein